LPSSVGHFSEFSFPLIGEGPQEGSTAKKWVWVYNGMKRVKK